VENESRDAADDDDTRLIQASRSGDRASYGELYQRHSPAAYRFACKLIGSVQGADDLVSEAFTKVLERIASGGGPSRSFAPYLLTTVRTTWYKQLAGERLVDRQVEISDLILPAESGDVVADRVDISLATRAFAGLPERWRQVLWHLEIEKESAAEVSELLGIRANAVAALAFRARDGLRLAYVQMHVKSAIDPECRETSANLAAWLCGRLKNRKRARIGHHLMRCRRCAGSAKEVSDLLAQIRRSVPLTVTFPVTGQPEGGWWAPRTFGDLLVEGDAGQDDDPRQANLPIRA
jgi:RNA polymerase sigma factor (sigma-70 family)